MNEFRRAANILVGIFVVLAALAKPAIAVGEEQEREREPERERAEGEKALASFLKSCGVRRSDIYFDRELTLFGKESARMLLAAGKEAQYLAAIDEEGGFVYIKMPWRERADLRDARILDLAGDGRQALVFRYREHPGGGDTREVLSIWRLPSESHIHRVFAAEVGRSAGKSRIENSVRFVRRGRATDLVIEAGRARGFTAADFTSWAPAGDVLPLVLPWSDERRARYQFAGDKYQRAP
jgi:hypothetical protein